MIGDSATINSLMRRVTQLEANAVALRSLLHDWHDWGEWFDGKRYRPTKSLAALRLMTNEILIQEMKP